MKSFFSFILVIAAVVLLGGCAVTGPKLDGQYQLVSRDLPGGTVQHSPDIGGWISWDDGLRIFHVYWKDARGKVFSIGSVARYKLEGGKYTETNVYYIEHDEISGKPVVYDFSNTTASSPFTYENGNLRFQLPLHKEPLAEFRGNTFSATREGAFVDHWELVGK